jgi:hypothetical protein
MPPRAAAARRHWLAAVHVCALLTGLLNAWVFLLVAGSDAAG